MPELRRLLAEKKADSAILAAQNFALRNYIRQLEKTIHHEQSMPMLQDDVANAKTETNGNAKALKRRKSRTRTPSNKRSARESRSAHRKSTSDDSRTDNACQDDASAIDGEAE
jgi:hypothetical protein